MLAFLLIVGGGVLAYANGANDNFKGVATLFGSGTTDYRRALHWATVTTLAGSVVSIFIAGKLVKIFSGAGLVSEQIAGNPAFLPAVACAAGATVLVASRLGMPISTTHSLLGALLGPAVVAGGVAVDFGYLGSKFVVPLLASPLIAVVFSYVLYSIFRATREALGVEKEMYLCVGGMETSQPIDRHTDIVSMRRGLVLGLSVETIESCEERYTGRVMGVNVQKALDLCHYVSAGMVSFARGLNDTPKIAAIILAAGILGVQASGLWVGLGIAIGGILGARRVGELMAKRIAPMNHGQGFTANIVTALLVIIASPMGVPVSTTHVSCASIFGIGVRTGQGDRAVMSTILLAWVTTLPVATAFGAVFFPLFSHIIASS